VHRPHIWAYAVRRLLVGHYHRSFAAGAWEENFGLGHVGSDSKAVNYYARAVRSAL